MNLPVEVVNDLQRDGYTKLNCLFRRDQVQDAKEQLRVLLAERGAPKAQNGDRVYNILGTNPLWEDFLLAPSLLAVAFAILGPELKVFSFQGHLVQPGGFHVFHIDQGHCPIDLKMDVVATAIIALDDFTEENGATLVCSGSHRWPEQPANGRYSEALARNANVLTGDAGSAFIFGGRLVHSVGVNRTEDTRSSLLVHFCQTWLQPFENFSNYLSERQLAESSTTVRALIANCLEGVGRSRGLRAADARLDWAAPGDHGERTHT